MNKEGPYRDQAERLRKKITKKAAEKTDVVKEELPPRSRVHRNKQTKKGIKVKYPVIRLLALFFILLPIIIFTVYTYANWGDSETTTASSGFETFDYGKNNENENEVIFEIDEQMDENKEEQPEEDKQQTEDQDQKADPAEQPSEPDSSNKPEQNNPKEPADETDKQQDEITNESNKQNSEPAEGKIVYHTVKASETLFRVSMNYYASPDGVEIIKQANGLSSNEIQAGQVLKIPLNQ